MNFAANNQEIFETNSFIYSPNTRNTHHLNPFMPEVEIFEFVHKIHIYYLEKFKEQEFEEKKILFHC